MSARLQTREKECAVAYRRETVKTRVFLPPMSSPFSRSFHPSMLTGFLRENPVDTLLLDDTYLDPDFDFPPQVGCLSFLIISSASGAVVLSNVPCARALRRK